MYNLILRLNAFGKWVKSFLGCKDYAEVLAFLHQILKESMKFLLLLFHYDDVLSIIQTQYELMGLFLLYGLVCQ